MDKWKTICSQALLDTKWVKVRKDAVELPNGQHIDDFYAITINEAAAIVALDDYGNIILKKEYRYCFGRDLIEIPAGGFERGEEGLEVATLYPLVPSVLQSLESQILSSQSLQGVTYSDSSQYTASLLIDAITRALKKSVTY